MDSGSGSWCRGMHSMPPPPHAALTWAEWPGTILTKGRFIGHNLAMEGTTAVSKPLKNEDGKGGGGGWDNC